jgi:hypothetical protein
MNIYVVVQWFGGVIEQFIYIESVLAVFFCHSLYFDERKKMEMLKFIEFLTKKKLCNKKQRREQNRITFSSLGFEPQLFNLLSQSLNFIFKTLHISTNINPQFHPQSANNSPTSLIKIYA